MLYEITISSFLHTFSLDVLDHFPKNLQSLYQNWYEIWSAGCKAIANLQFNVCSRKEDTKAIFDLKFCKNKPSATRTRNSSSRYSCVLSFRLNRVWERDNKIFFTFAVFSSCLQIWMHSSRLICAVFGRSQSIKLAHTTRSYNINKILPVFFFFSISCAIL